MVYKNDGNLEEELGGRGVNQGNTDYSWDEGLVFLGYHCVVFIANYIEVN